MKNTSNKSNSKPRSLVTKKLENVSKELFRKHYDLITDLVSNSHGIYALYDGNDLYYVGKSTDLRKRVRHHLRDKHYASWTHFSLYLVRNEDHIHEIESLLIRIANPKGNSLIPKSNKGSTLLKQLKLMVKQKHKKELDDMFGENGRNKSKKKSGLKHPKTLDGLVSKNTALFKEYKGKEYKAVLTPKGIIKIGNKTFQTPTAAAKSIVDRTAVNGWNFWYIKDASGEWVRLGEYRD